MNICCNCNKETKSNYSVNNNNNGILCGECAKEIFDEKIKQKQDEIYLLKCDIGWYCKWKYEAVSADCEHDFRELPFEDTNPQCIKCGKSIYPCEKENK